MAPVSRQSLYYKCLPTVMSHSAEKKETQEYRGVGKGDENLIRILFVCHGNICRSPSAELIFKDLLAKKALSHLYTVASAATSDEEIWNGCGNPVYPPMAAVLCAHGISVEGKRAVQLVGADAEKYDLFIGMDEANLRNMRHILGRRAEGRMYKLMDFTPRGGDVSDPWYTRRFDIAYEDIREGCEALLAHLTEKSGVV